MFVTYENRNNPHVTIHCPVCSHLRKHGGVHQENSRGKYENHKTYADAKKYAEETELPVIICSRCNPPNCN